MAGFPLPFASIQNDFLRIDYLTTTGPRVIGLHARGVEGNLLAETPDVHWTTPHGEYYLLGGHRVWTAPEDPRWICPEGKVTVIADESLVTLQGEPEASGLQKEISFRLDQNRVRLSHRVSWHGKQPIELAAWAITQLRLGGLAILPLSTSEGLLPNRSLVLWPYSQIDEPRLELYDDLVLLHGRAAQHAFKIGNYSSHGWLACVWDEALFVKRFVFERNCQYPDMGSNVEAYVKDSCLELETLGPSTLLQPGGSVTHEETWEVTVGEYSTRLEDVRSLSRQLSK